MAKKMGTNPLTGLNGLIRNTQAATVAHDIANDALESFDSAREPGYPARGSQSAGLSGLQDRQPTEPALEDAKLAAAEAQYIQKTQSAQHNYDAHPVHDTKQPHSAHSEHITHEVQNGPLQGFQMVPDPLAAGGTSLKNADSARNNMASPQSNDSTVEPAIVGTQGRKGHKLPRINMAFAPEHLVYLQAMSGFERMSATQYVNNLIRADMEKREALYQQLNELRGK